ncbi:sigma-70 family RNA polymerase sigma factor [Pseudoflavitalea sp. G-6-1-2]|uniref:RNA polymerase sigma factor n=1 Tax=Pseudoflavitalea sp. G-6-1-2 TaxID=2728841 RepID=UPI00146CC868|nr:sigma-70 family RNA polymerase sigma factor [Pseudoflavitalea sp. G-6-1-2]NML23120.1 sigma-70 family RNA polymerase sigma factor [Pseudoflavitalea sp. G-6-1-2]
MTPIINDTETTLLSLLRAGDEQAFTQIYKLYWEKLYFIAHKRLQSAEDSKEIVQNVFFTLWQKRTQLEIQNLPVYLFAMTRYAVYRHLDNEKRKAGLLSKFRRQHKDCDYLDIDNKQLLDLLMHFSEDLPENYRLVFLHHKLKDETLESVAAQLSVSPRTAERYVSKVLSIIRHRLQKMGATIFSNFF